MGIVRIALLSVLLSAVTLAAIDQKITSKEGVTHRMSFGSCFNFPFLHVDSTIFKSLSEYKPDSFVWLGDVTYLDDFDVTTISFSLAKDQSAYPTKFEEAKQDPNYKLIRESSKIYGTWDDHDSGINNGGKNNPVKETIRQMFLDFLDEPAGTDRRTRPDGLYTSVFLDEDKRIKLILLDCRYSRDEWEDDSIPFEEKSTLGKAQEEWAVKEIMESTADFTIVAAGTQILPDDRFTESFYPNTRELLVGTVNPNTNIIFLTGDVHIGEMMLDECTAHLHGYALREYTSSGLTHSEGYYPVLGPLVGWIGDFVNPPRYSHNSARYLDRNVGVIDFHIGKEKGQSSYTFRLLDHEGRVRLEETMGPDYFKKKTKPDTQAYLECRRREQESHSEYGIWLHRLGLWRHPITLGIYIAFGMVILGLWIVVRAFKRAINRSKSKTE